jgi:hypothetical protein
MEVELLAGLDVDRRGVFLEVLHQLAAELVPGRPRPRITRP